MQEQDGYLYIKYFNVKKLNYNVFQNFLSNKINLKKLNKNLL